MVTFEFLQKDFRVLILFLLTVLLSVSFILESKAQQPSEPIVSQVTTGDLSYSETSVLQGASSGRFYYTITPEGFTIYLPSDNGGELSFKVWNEQGTCYYCNTLNTLYYPGSSIQLNTYPGNIDDFFTSSIYDVNYELIRDDKSKLSRGVAGGKIVELEVEAGISEVVLKTSKNKYDWSMEISDINFKSEKPSITQTPLPTTTKAHNPTVPALNGRIAFTSDRDGNLEIYTMNADGTNLAQLTRNIANDSIPSWSPDGSKIAFISDRNGNYEIYTMETDGTNPVQLTRNAVTAFLSWSPDGSKIAFASYKDGNSEIYTMNTDGTNPVQLTRNAVAAFPSWFPDGSKIAFASFKDGNGEIYTMNADGTNPVQLTRNIANDSFPSWSPDGSKIAFSSDRNGNYEIYTMETDGTNPVQLTSNNVADFLPIWSPDGSKIAFASYKDGNSEIYTMNADGTNPVELTTNIAIDAASSWSSSIAASTSKRIISKPVDTTKTPLPISTIRSNSPDNGYQYARLLTMMPMIFLLYQYVKKFKR